MSMYFKLTVTSMTCHHLYITTPDDVTQEKVFVFSFSLPNFRIWKVLVLLN